MRPTTTSSRSGAGGSRCGPGSEHGFTYRLHWGADAPLDPKLARVTEVMTGPGDAPGLQVYVLDVQGPALQGITEARVEAQASFGTLRAGFAGPNPETGGWRISLELDSPGLSELRCVLVGAQGPLMETWLYRHEAGVPAGNR